MLRNGFAQPTMIGANITFTARTTKSARDFVRASNP
jgi:hypothetical protein